MNLALFLSRTHAGLILFLWSGISVLAQNGGESVPPPMTQFQQMESTYQAELRKIHLPLLSSYVNELKRLAAQSKTAEVTVAIETELKNIQTVIGSGGVVDLSGLLASIKDGGQKATPESPPTKALPSLPRAVLMLDPQLAASITPPRDPASSGPQPITAIEWAVEAVPAGNYDVVIHYALPALTDPNAVIRVTLGENQIELPIRPPLVTGDPGSYRIARVGRFQLESDVSNAKLKLDLVGEGPLPEMRVRYLAVLRPPPPSGGKPPPPPQ